VYGHTATATGWTFSQIDQLTLWDLNDLFEYWQDYPPTHVLVTAYLTAGNKNRSSTRKRQSRGDKFEELTQAVATAGGGTTRKLPEVYKNDLYGA